MHFEFECLRTRRSFTSYIEIDSKVVARYWGKDITCGCPYCGGQHAYDFKKHYVAAAINSEPDIAARPLTSL